MASNIFSNVEPGDSRSEKAMTVVLEARKPKNQKWRVMTRATRKAGHRFQC